MSHIGTKRMDMGNGTELHVFLYGMSASAGALCLDFYVLGEMQDSYVLVAHDASIWPVEHHSAEVQADRRFVNIRRSNGRKVRQYSYELTATHTLNETMSEFFYDAPRADRRTVGR